MIIHTMQQYSTEWWAERCGLPTASTASKILTPGGVLSKSSSALINALIADRLGIGDPPFEQTEWMLRGTELEPEARHFFEFDTGKTVKEVGFITNNDKTAGCSPDGLILFDKDLKDQYRGGFEVKCPKASTHIGYLLRGGLIEYYRPQVHWSMATTGLRRWALMSYHPELDPLIINVEWDEYTDSMAKAIDQFALNLYAAMEKMGIKNE